MKYFCHKCGGASAAESMLSCSRCGKPVCASCASRFVLCGCAGELRYYN